ncbi:MAG: TolC family protein [Sulfuricurvum sp.]|uniref:TolC family protein n=1 Tax=Sulfuricurvum sp. TaxID=2025608 RepID=UPI002623B2E0|nr:TolC family protein [Sulfuricurvum sp.]MDD2828786.1 TolC family protein [Sulfuricurvum sp.]MDD4948755.1 TolC family protein [Sulfuricurvum sp.]
MASPTQSLALTLLLGALNLSGSSLSLDEAITLLKEQNLEIKASSLEAKNASNDVSLAQGYNFGSLDFTENVVRSNDAGNVFGFKLSSREANFGDFGAQEFMNNFMAGSPDYVTPPNNLNYPGYQNYFQSKLTYMVPLYTGGKLSSYSKIATEMEKIKQLDTANVTAEKIYETRKSYYDMALLEHSIQKLKVIQKNIATLETTTEEMLKEGYAKKVDLLEVEAKKSNVDRMIAEMEGNKKLLYHYISFLLNQNVSEITVPTNDRATSTVTEADVIANNNDLKKAAHGLEVRSSMVDVAYAPLLPTLGAFAEASSADNTFLGNFKDHAAYTVGARLSWNLFNGGVDHYALEKARIDHLKTATEVELAKKGIALQYDKTRTEIDTLDIQITSLEKELEFSTQIYQNYEGRYREHLASMSDLIIKQSEQIEKIINLQMIKNKRNERIFALEKLSNGAKQ